jgi:guanylate kinase
MSSFKKGGMYIFSSPSGAGKTTIVRKISKNRNFLVSISHTTRLPRPMEKDGHDYYFTSKKNFKKLIKKGEFLEHAKVFGNYYGSSKKLVTLKLKQGKNIIFDIDWQGTRQIRNKKLNYKLTTFFIIPPSKEELLKRLIKREKKNMKTVNKRMKEFKKHLSKWKEYDHVVINDNLKLCYKKIMNIIRSKKKQLSNQSFIKKHINKLLI